MPKKEDTVLITGGLGQIGYHVFILLKDEYEVVIVDDLSNSKAEPPSEALFIQGKIEDEQIYESLPDIHYIIHCAAQINVERSSDNPVFDAQSNILGTINLLEYSRKIKVKKFVFISSAATYGEPQFLPITEDHPRNPISFYGLSKLTAENYCLLYSKLFQLPVTVLIPFNVYSTLQNENDPYSGVVFKFIKAASLNESLTIFGDGEQVRDFIHAKDVAHAIKLALTSSQVKAERINIGSGHPISINELASKILSFSRIKQDVVHVSPKIGDIYKSYCSIEKAKNLLNFCPRISLEEGLRELVEKFQKNKTKG